MSDSTHSGGTQNGVSNDRSLGFGLLHPFQRDRKSDFAAAGGEALVRSAVSQILGTMGASDYTQGEIPWRTEQGSLLSLLRHQQNNIALQELARVYVEDALRRWEPRVQVKSVDTTRDRNQGDNVLTIRIRYDVVSPSSGNVVISNVEQTVKIPGSTTT